MKVSLQIKMWFSFKFALDLIISLTSPTQMLRTSFSMRIFRIGFSVFFTAAVESIFATLIVNVMTAIQRRLLGGGTLPGWTNNPRTSLPPIVTETGILPSVPIGKYVAENIPFNVSKCVVIKLMRATMGLMLEVALTAIKSAGARGCRSVFDRHYRLVAVKRSKRAP